MCHYSARAVCKNIHREKVSASDDYVTLGHVFPKVYYHHESSHHFYVLFFRHSNFQFSTLFFSGNNHNQNRKSSLKLERDIKPKSEGISILRIIINRIKSVKYVSLVRFAQFWLFNQKITKLVCFAQLWFFFFCAKITKITCSFLSILSFLRKKSLVRFAHSWVFTARK